jgi:hypothetical protein
MGSRIRWHLAILGRKVFLLGIPITDMTSLLPLFLFLPSLFHSFINVYSYILRTLSYYSTSTRGTGFIADGPILKISSRRLSCSNAPSHRFFPLPLICFFSCLFPRAHYKYFVPSGVTLLLSLRSASPYLPLLRYSTSLLFRLMFLLFSFFPSYNLHCTQVR